MNKCTKCGVEAPDDSKFCQNCGNVIEPQKKSIFRRLWGVINYFLLYIGLQILIMGIATIVLAVIGEAGDIDFDSIIENDGFTSLILLISAAAALFVMWFTAGKEWKATGFWDIRRSAPVILLICVCLGLCMSFFVNAVIGSLVTLASESDGVPASFNTDLGNPFIAFLSLNIAVPVIEEVVFRGYMLRRLKEMKLNTAVALIIQAIVFMLVHLDGVAMVYSLPLGIIFGIIYLWFGSIWASIAAHIAFNSFSDLFAIVFNANNEVASAGIWALCSLLGLALTIVLMIVLKRKRNRL